MRFCSSKSNYNDPNYRISFHNESRVWCDDDVIMSLTNSADSVCPADDIGVSLMKLSSALYRNFTVIKLLDMPGVHGNRLKLHLMSLLQCDDPMTPLDIDTGQHGMDQAVPFH